MVIHFKILHISAVAVAAVSRRHAVRQAVEQVVFMLRHPGIIICQSCCFIRRIAGDIRLFNHRSTLRLLVEHIFPAQIFFIAGKMEHAGILHERLAVQGGNITKNRHIMAPFRRRDSLLVQAAEAFGNGVLVKIGRPQNDQQLPSVLQIYPLADPAEAESPA